VLLGLGDAAQPVAVGHRDRCLPGARRASTGSGSGANLRGPPGGYSRWLGRKLGFDSDSGLSMTGFLLRSGQILMAIELPHMVAAVEAECIRPGLRISVERTEDRLLSTRT